MKTILLAILFCASLAHAQRSSANYSITSETVDSFGESSASANYSNRGSGGKIGGTGTSANYTARHGYIGQLYETTGLDIFATPATINEGGTRQLSANSTLDDGSVLPLSSSSVAWSILTGPIASINSSGLATAGIVYQNTPATVQGSLDGFVDTLSLDVINVNIDNFQTYAGDGLDDAWQVQHFGIDNPDAQPGDDPDGDGQNNRFEYFADTDPDNSLSLFQLWIERVPAQPTHKDIVFTPRHPHRQYRVQFRNNFESGAFAPLLGTATSDSGLERTVTDLNATGPSKYYRVEISFP